MRILPAIAALVMAGVGASACRTEKPDSPDVPTPESGGSVPELVVYTYDSMVAEGGLGEKIFPLFEKQCGCRVKALAAGDAGAMVARLQLDAERGKPKAHVVLGVDQNQWSSVQKYAEWWGTWAPKGWELVPEEFKIGDGFLPFDYGVFAFIADMEALKKEKLLPPRSFGELTASQWRRKFILQDPRTSTPGLAFFNHLVSGVMDGEVIYAGTGQTDLSKLKGKDASDFLVKRFQENALGVFPGWDAAYGAFLKGEAPLVWSYTTSEAYHREEGKGERYRALVFDKPHPVQIEAAALVKGAFQDQGEKDRARAFLEFLISEPAQAAVPKGNWMLPVRRGTPLPESFGNLAQPKILIHPEFRHVKVIPGGNTLIAPTLEDIKTPPAND